MEKQDWDKLEPRVQKNLLDAHHQTLLHTYDKNIREALKIGVDRAIADGRPQTDVAVILLAKNDAVVAGLPEEKKPEMVGDYNVIFGYRQDLAKMSPWGDPNHEYHELMSEMVNDHDMEEGEVSVVAAVFAFDTATIRRLYFTPKKFDLKPRR